MARIIIFSENYGGPGTGQFVHRLSVALSGRGHSVQGKATLSMSDVDSSGMQADLIIGQHRAAGVGRAIAGKAKIPFVLIMQGEKYISSMAADLVVFASKGYISGYQEALGSTPAISTENGIDELCARISVLAEASSAENLRRSKEVAATREAADNAARAAAEAAATKARVEAAARAQTHQQPYVPVHHPYIPPTINARSPASAHAPPAHVPAGIPPRRLPPAKPSGEPIVSVVIVAQDDESIVEHTIKNVLGQNYKDVEVILVDDGSSDGTGKIVSAVSDQRLMVFRRPWKSGRHAARNLGFAQSSGEFVMFLDAGDAVTTDAIGALVARIRAESTPGSTIGRPTNVTEQHRRWVFAAGGISDHDALHVADTIALYRREAVDMAGKFTEAVSVREMDADFVKRVAATSSIMFVDTPVGSRRHAAVSRLEEPVASVTEAPATSSAADAVVTQPVQQPAAPAQSVALPAAPSAPVAPAPPPTRRIAVGGMMIEVSESIASAMNNVTLAAPDPASTSAITKKS